MLDSYLKDKNPEQMGTDEVKQVLNYLEKNGFNDRYCSNQEYLQKSLIPVEGHMYRRNNDECRAVRVPVGTTYSDGVKEQQANVEGALFIVDAKGGARITNVPTDYKSVSGRDVVAYGDVLKATQMASSKDR